MIDAEEGPEEGWTPLDRRTVAVTAVLITGAAAGAGIPAIIGIAAGRSVGFALAWVLPAAAALVVSGALYDEVRWRRTRYRIGPSRVDLQTGLLVRTRRSLPLDRVRSVDITAGPLLRAFGLVVVRIGTGQHGGTGERTLELRPVEREEGDRLRTVLLDRVRSAGGCSAEAADGRLAWLDPRWVRFAPLSFATPLLGVAAVVALLQIADRFGLQNSQLTEVVQVLDGLPLVAVGVLLAVVVLLVGVLGSLGLFAEMWWNYRLDREPGGTLRVRRGLLTTRSISLEECRLRGVELVEPLGGRLAGAARVDAVTTGLTSGKDDRTTEHTTLLPAAPRPLAHRVAAVVLGEPVSPTASVRLAAHPPAARQRRLRWALAAVAVPVLVLAALGLLVTDVLLMPAGIVAVLAGPVAVVLALDAYRNLGHGITGGYLVMRSGTIRRRTVALQRNGIIGLTAKQSIFQRRSGLITITATTAAGAGAFSAYDVDASAGLRFAEEAVPDLLGPFLECDGSAPLLARRV
ncbi:PH domain-containing protein [Pseudonocardia acidicola]|uniref:PH domain-containing protein n=1 Tax=Pseudonocardia acidicola TaxID=2724939 RepID=A0ABX1SBP0_9PSEU|nr:PH domain-containing protein [Pseudonocardia acidicola]NMH98976.1 PH domain-containing protein [Pseudonocardia acidicola]